ncbi:hypothetical protein MMC11_007402 [Xylographa trunciseda]|nr:hypothetical protein [Xylographa trunciseda]
MFDLIHERFVYQSLDTATNEIRLIKILPELERGDVQCQVEHFPFEQAPPYIALSYTWQNPIPDREAAEDTHDTLIRANKTTLRIGNNLASALEYLRRHRSLEYVWADAICIDQANLLERGQQVLRIAKIYGAARETIAWLGPEYQDSNLAFDLMRLLANVIPDSMSDRDLVQLVRRYLTDKAYANEWKALGCLLERKWWYRIWIIQEMVVSRNVNLACGEDLISWDALTHSLASLFVIYTDLAPILESENISISVRPLNNINAILLFISKIFLETSLHIERFLFRIDEFVATDPRDYIYAILALASDANALVPYPNYIIATQDVYNTFVRSYIEHYKSVDIIHLRPRPDARSPLPSWVPDLDLREYNFSIKNSLYFSYAEENGLLQCAAASTVPLVFYSPDFRVLTCQGTCIDVVDGCSVSEREASNGQVHLLQPVYQRCAYETSEGAFTAIWRTLIGDLFWNEDGITKPSEEIGLLFARQCRKYDDGFVHQPWEDRRFTEWYKRAKHFVMCGRTLQNWVNDTTEVPYVLSKADDEVWLRFTHRVSAGLGRKLITTERGYVGTGPDWLQRGDKVCILLGSSLPVLLRPIDDHHMLIGPCYIHGIMFGEAMSLLDGGEVELEDFAIH